MSFLTWLWGFFKTYLTVCGAVLNLGIICASILIVKRHGFKRLVRIFINPFER